MAGSIICAFCFSKSRKFKNAEEKVKAFRCFGFFLLPDEDWNGKHNLLILVGAVKASDRVVREMLGLYKRARGPRTHPLRRGDYPIREQLSEKYEAVSADDDQA